MLEESPRTDTSVEVRQAKAAVKEATYTYRSYNPQSLQLYAQRYYWWVTALPFVVLNCRTAVTRVLAWRIMLPGNNPTNLSKQLLESKTEWFDGVHAQVRSPPSPCPCFLSKAPRLSHIWSRGITKTVGLCWRWHLQRYARWRRRLLRRQHPAGNGCRPCRHGVRPGQPAALLDERAIRVAHATRE